MASGGKRRVGRVTTVPPTAFTSDAKLLDFLPVPLPIFILFRIIVFWGKHWYIAGLIILYFFVGWQWFLALLLSVPITFYLFIYAANIHHNPLAVLRVAYRLGRSRRLWKRACEAADLNNGPYKPFLYTIRRPPRIKNERGTSIAFTLSLSRVSKTVTDLEKGQEYLVAGMQARRSRVKRLTPGIGELTLEWDRTGTTSRFTNANASTDPNQETQLPTVELDEEVHLEMDTSLLVVGQSGSGKSNLTWNLLNGLNENRVPYRLNIIDPKAVELALLADCPYTNIYVDRARDSERVINAFHSDMEERLQVMKATKTRRIQISQSNPLRLLIIDELLLLGAQIKNGAVDTPLGEILSIGRAAGFVVIANSQLGQVDVIGRIRDLFPQRICLAVRSEDLTNAVLGPRAEQRGARCTEITEKGTGYIYTDRMGSFQRFRPPYINDDQIKTVALGGWISPTIPRGWRFHRPA